MLIKINKNDGLSSNNNVVIIEELNFIINIIFMEKKSCLISPEKFLSLFKTSDSFSSIIPFFVQILQVRFFCNVTENQKVHKQIS